MVAVFRELQKTGDHELRFWCDKKFGASARGIFAKFEDNIPVELIIAGKLRRYHGKSISSPSTTINITTKSARRI
ncbi:hypothetical protein [Candidatus Minimicrobia vallesae]|uniref:hypothetical protein n=1 Tax=Candidatus Minimicrobia vallesae TaxID=2841264 RepID=UPI0022B805C8|nr:hypothetical protein [Candidatus Minimicrobia vallesae]